MHRLLPLRLCLLAAACSISTRAGAQALGEARRPSSKFSGEAREAPDRDGDAIHLKLEISFDWEKKEISGAATHTFRGLRDGVRSIHLDAIGIGVSRVTDAGGAPLSYQTGPEKLRIDLARELRRGEETVFRIEYQARPDRGVYFRLPDAAYPNAPRQVWTQGEATEARHWIPCFDHPSDKISSEVLVTAPEGLFALSNGKLAGEPASAPGGGKIFHWVQEKPHATYLICVVVGDFAEYHDEWNGVPIRAYVPRHRAADAERSFKLTRDMMGFFSERTGVPYPWAKYGQVCVHEFMMGGMENTSLTTLTESTLHDAAADLDVDSTGLVAHELAHQWFGDLVTCRDWAEIWLNESFATFMENLYLEKLRGWDEGVYERIEEGDHYLAEDRNSYRRPLVTYRYRGPDDLFDAHAYPKGARILSMLRFTLGDDLFFDGIHRYLTANAYRSAESTDLRAALEEASGRSLRWFFDEWVHGAGHPEYRIQSEYDEAARMVRLEVKQVQRLENGTSLFRMPVEIEITTATGRTVHRALVSKSEETFSFPADSRPRRVRFDPRDWILKEIEFPRSREEFLDELESDGEISGRIEAARGLAKHRDEAVRKALVDRLAREPFFGVRVEIVKALRGFGGEAVRDELLRAFGEEKKSRVRREIVQALGEFPGEKTVAFLKESIDRDPSYFVAGDGLRALARLDRRGALPVAYRALDRDSHEEEIRRSAIGVIQENDGLEGKERDEAIDKLLAWHQRGKPIPARIAAGAALARVGKGVERVYQALAAAVDDPAIAVRFSAFSQLAELGDRRGIEVLQRRKGKETHRAFRDPLDAIDGAVKRLEGVGDKEQLLDELRRLREGREDLERRVKLLEGKGTGEKR